MTEQQRCPLILHVRELPRAEGWMDELGRRHPTTITAYCGAPIAQRDAGIVGEKVRECENGHVQ